MIANGPADAIATLSFLASLKSRLVKPFWCQLTHAVVENGCLSRRRVQCVEIKTMLIPNADDNCTVPKLCQQNHRLHCVYPVVFMSSFSFGIADEVFLTAQITFLYHHNYREQGTIEDWQCREILQPAANPLF